MDVGKKETTPRKWGGRRRFAAGLNVSASLVLAVGAFVMVNYLTHRYLHLRVDVSRSSFYELSGKTTEMLSKCDADIDVYVLFSRNEDETGCYSEIRNLLDEYRYFAGGVDTLGIEVMYVDPDVDGAKAKKLRQEFDLRDPQVVIFKNNRGGKSEVVPERHIVEYEYKPLDSGLRQERVKSVFRGEQVFSSAILRITEEKKPVVYSVRGHDEHDVGDYAMHVGYSDIAHAMYLDNVDLRSISLTEMQGIPADCDVLLIAGPTRAFHPAEVELIAQYLKSNRNLLLLLDAGQTTGLEPLLEEWGIRGVTYPAVEITYMMNSDGVLTPLSGAGDEIYVRKYGSHRITKKLGDVVTAFYAPRALMLVDAAGSGFDERPDKPLRTVLAATSKHGWAETDPEQDPPRYDTDVDRRGPIPVAVAVERGAIRDVRAELKPVKMVVIGDSDFVANGKAAGGNEDFFMNSLNWLLERESLMEVSPREYGRTPLLISDRDRLWLFGIVVAAMPVAAVLLGLVVWSRRSR